MIIQNGFYLHGFTRYDMGEAGAVFIHYAEEKEKERKLEIRETPLIYGGAGTVNYTLSIPKQVQKIIACAVVTRTSKNCYQATVFDDPRRRIEMFKADSLDSLRRMVADFFGV